MRVSAADGQDMTPVGAKHQALLALLALSPGMTRGRRWIEDKLWSTFGPTEASANLRQALTHLRKHLGPHRDVLLSDRVSIAIDAKRVSVDVLAPGFGANVAARHDLLEGLDVRDPEFEDWLRDERARVDAALAHSRPRATAGLLVRTRSGGQGGTMADMVGDILANQIGENIAENVRAWRQSGDPAGDTATPPDLEISCDVLGHSEAGPHRVFIKIVHLPSARILYSKLHPLAALEDVLTSERAIASVVFEAADRVVGQLPQIVENARPEARATALSRLAMYRMFSFEPEALREADKLLSQAQEIDANGVYTAWRSLIRTIQYIELLEENSQALIEEVEALNHQALEAGADNALVQALISQVRVMTLGDAAGAIDLAEQSVERNPNSGFGWQALAAARMLAGDPKEAFRHSRKGREIARFSPFRQWWDLYHCIVAVACNDPQEAIIAGEAAARAAPSFRPAHRHLLALYALDGQLDKAQGVADRLARIEPGFSLDRIINDESYPVRTLRRTGMLEPIRNLL